MISLAAPEDLSTFVRDVVREMTPVSTITIEHTTQGGGHAIEQRAIISKEEFLVLDEALRGRRASATRPSAYMQAPAVARMLGIKTGTLAKWRRLGTGPRGWVRTNRTSVAYPLVEVEAFIRRWESETNDANRHKEIQKSGSGPEVEPTN
ncbi:MAG TPA: hypothetical protein VLC46_00645 [Thermoanaerobaculia bacterium]|jgi:hypothetical protein|nr:hypothetical protein [Thermoanaerobaculia bacterium]